MLAFFIIVKKKKKKKQLSLLNRLYHATDCAMQLAQLLMSTWSFQTHAYCLTYCPGVFRMQLLH